MFVLHTLGGVSTPALEYLPCSAIVPKIGMAMAMADGLLEVANGATAPTYICMTKRDEACKAGELIPVIRVQHNTVFATTFANNDEGVELGFKLQISADGLQVTTTVGGPAEVVGYEGTDEGDTVYVRF